MFISIYKNDIIKYFLHTYIMENSINIFQILYLIIQRFLKLKEIISLRIKILIIR